MRPRLCRSISVTPVGTHPVRSAATYKRSASTALAGTTIQLVQILVQELVLFLNNGSWFSAWSNLCNPNLTGLVALTQLTATRLSLFQWNPGPAQEPHEKKLRGLFFKKTRIMFRIAHTKNTDFAVLLIRDTFEPDPMVLACQKTNVFWGMVLLIVR